MTAEEFSNIEKEFREMDECGFALRYMYLGNHIRLTDGTDLGPWSSQPGNGPALDDSAATILLSFLPAEAFDRDTLDIKLTIREVIEYHYKNGEKYYYGNEPLEEKTVTITVPRQCQKDLTCSQKQEGYKVLYYLITLILAPIAIYFMGKNRLKALNHTYGLDESKPKDEEDNDKT